ncbi:LLM class flavin-dependent oxidoreductase [Saccharopolyspora griseoalba]|uniref:LLM class flavin-dependent oxidoreductase n=1 Tax=Saccharopolyspora griseoalba TaxID=1431848 RepID=A0ABW2LCK2_9PSEU
MSSTSLDGHDFKLGLFSPNCSGGLAMTTVAERWDASWSANLRLARLADDAGIDFVLPIARWIGYDGASDFHRNVLEPIPWAAALLAATRRITIFATVHTAFNHPVVSAKQLATLDQVGGGRAGLNIVAGWNEPEYRAMGLRLPESHDERYALAQEWWDHVHALWTREGTFDLPGRFFDLEGVESAPKPVRGTLPVINAGSSPQGRAFAARNADFVFTGLRDPDDGADVVEQIRTAAKREHGRDVGVMTPAFAVCRPTRREAEEYLRHYAEDNADWAAVDQLMKLQGAHTESFATEALRTFRPRFAAGHGACPLIGSPDDVAEQIARYADAGLAGMTLSFVDYLGELEHFAAEVLPRLQRRGIRLPRA